MAGSLVQAAYGVRQNNASSCTVVCPTAVTAGNTLIVVGVTPQGGGLALNTPTDTIGNSYTLVTSSTADGSGWQIYIWKAINIAGGSNTITSALTAGPNECMINFAEIGGVTANPLDGFAEQFDGGVGTGNDAITSGNASNSLTAFAYGFVGQMLASTNTIVHGTGYTSTAGTNITVNSTGWYGGTNVALIEWRSGLAAGSHAATFTDPTNANTAHQTLIVMLDEDQSQVTDTLTAGTNTDLVLNNQNWNYTQESATNDIICGTKGAFCNAQVGANFVNALYTGAFTADQSAQVTLASFVTGAQAGVGVRYTAGVAGPNCYVAYFDNAHWNLGLLNNGSFTTLSGGQQPRTNNVGDVVILQARGNTITLTAGGTTLKTVTDNTWSQGQPGIAFTGVHPSTIVRNFKANSLGILTPAFTISTVVGQLGDQVSEAITQQTIASSSSSSGITVSLTRTFAAGPTATFVEGQLINVLQISGQTATFAEGSLTTSITGGATLTLGAQTLGFAEGALADNISYLLDQGSLAANLIGQTSTFVQGTLTLSVVPALTAETVTSVEGVPTTSLTLAAATAQTVTSVEGIITANLGNNVTTTLVGQTLASAEGSINETVAPALTAETGTFVVGNMTFSNSGTFVVQLGGLSGNFIEGIIGAQLPTGGYPNVVGTLLEQATAQLEKTGAIVPASIGYFGTWPITVTWVPSPTVPPFVVIAQSFIPTAPIVANAPISLVVSQPNENVAYP